MVNLPQSRRQPCEVPGSTVPAVNTCWKLPVPLMPFNRPVPDSQAKLFSPAAGISHSPTAVAPSAKVHLHRPLPTGRGPATRRAPTQWVLAFSNSGVLLLATTPQLSAPNAANSLFASSVAVLPCVQATNSYATSAAIAAGARAISPIRASCVG